MILMIVHLSDILLKKKKMTKKLKEENMEMINLNPRMNEKKSV